VPPPPVGGAAVGTGLGDGLCAGEGLGEGVGVTVGDGLGDDDVVADALGLGVGVVVLDVPSPGETDAVAEAPVEGEDVGSAPDVGDVEQAETAARANMVKTPTASLTLGLVPATRPRLMEPPRAPGRWPPRFGPRKRRGP